MEGSVLTTAFFTSMVAAIPVETPLDEPCVNARLSRWIEAGVTDVDLETVLQARREERARRKAEYLARTPRQGGRVRCRASRAGR